MSARLPAELEKANVSKEIVLISNFQHSVIEDDLDDFMEPLVGSLQQNRVRSPRQLNLVVVLQAAHKGCPRALAW